MRKLMRNMAVLLVPIAVILVIACAGHVEPKEIPHPSPPESTPSPVTLVLPADDASHPAPIEWWYYNGHLSSGDGEEFSFHFVIFQTLSNTSTGTFEIGQAGITDVNDGAHYYISSDGFASRQVATTASAENIVNLDLGNFTLDIEPDGSHVLRVSDERSGTGLNLRTEIPESVMLHDGIGWMDWPFGWTYYYSYPRMATEGSLTLDDRKIDVSGEVWFDHQWGDFFVVGKPAGWQWFAMHLADGSSLMISEVRGANGQVIATDGTLVDPEGRQRILDADQDGIQLNVLSNWTSPRTGGKYPASWRLRIETLDIDITMSPTISDQEVPALPFGNKAAAYWEGRIDVYNSVTGEAKGVGFAELSGYVDPEPLIWRTAVP